MIRYRSLGVAMALCVLGASACSDKGAVGVGGVAGPTPQRDAGNNAENNQMPDAGDEEDVPEQEDVDEPEPDVPVDTACESAGDCEEEDEICVVDRTDTESPTDCGEPVGDGDPGDECVEDADCAANLCLEGVCVEPCGGDEDCPEPLICLEQDLGGGVSVPVCVPDLCDRPADCEEPDVCQALRGDDDIAFICNVADDDLADLGEPCEGDGACRSDLCVEGRCSGPCGEDGDCEAEVPMTCEGVEVALTEGNVGIDACVGPPVCESDTACEDDTLCVFVRGDAILHAFCGAALDDPGLPPGAECEDDGDCDRGLCQGGACTQACVGDEDCAPGLVCQNRVVALEEGNVEAQLCGVLPEDACGSDVDCDVDEGCVARRRPDRVDFVCGELNEDGAPQGDPCGEDVDCAHNLCEDGACADPCRLLSDCPEGLLCVERQVEVELGEAPAQLCTPPEICEAPSQCDDELTCVVRDVGEEDIETVCLPPNPGGQPIGSPCTEDAECAENLCLEDFLSIACSHPCGQDDDCQVEGYRCRAREVRGTPASSVAVCVPPDPDPCLTSDDCSNGQSCVIVPNRANTALVSVCTDTPSNSLPGTACEEDADCDSELCLDGFCSGLCQGPDDCGIEQLCEAQQVEREGLDGIFEICRTLEDIVCQHNPQCDDGNRVCGLIEFGDNETPSEFHCTFPEPEGGPIGAPCDGRISPSDQCFNRICLTQITAECTAACVDNDDCAGVPGGYVCTEFGFPGGPMRMCANDCNRDGDCERDDHVCGLSRNTGDDRFEFICRIQSGGNNPDPPGADCSERNLCDHGTCLIRGETRTCTLPCVTDDDCPPQLSECGDATIARPVSQETQTLRVCSPP